MATKSGDLAQALIEGGLAPQAARIIANAIANASSPTLSRGGDQTDATPVEDLRLITADTRRYKLTNLDYSPNEPFQERLSTSPGAYEDPTQDHPYKDSQPIVSAPPLSSPRVQGGNYVGVENVVDGGSAVSKVDLKLRTEQGRHLRLDPSTKSLEAVNFLTSTESPKVMAAEWRESENGTEIVISLRNLEELDVLLANADSRKALVFPQAAAVGPASLAAGGTRSLTKKAVRWEDGTSQDILVWTDGAATAAPTPPAAVCIAYVVFDASKDTTGASTGAATDRLIISGSANVQSVLKVAGGRYELTFSPALSTSDYAVVGSGSRNNDDDLVVVTTRLSTAPSTTKLLISIRISGNSAVDPARVSVALFA